MTLRERWTARETKIGCWIKNWIGKLLIACSALGGANEYLQVVPQDWIPQWIKAAILVAGIIGFVAGKMSVKKTAITVLLGMALMSCGTNAKLKHAKRLIADAKAMGATVVRDTIRDTIKLKGKETIVTVTNRHDTTIYKDNIRYQTIHHHDTTWTYIHCPDSTLIVPVAVNEAILCDDHKWRYLGMGAGFFLLLIVIIAWIFGRIVPQRK
jgi:hypothetical protein